MLGAIGSRYVARPCFALGALSLSSFSVFSR
jgi:hypothetical protein